MIYSCFIAVSAKATSQKSHVADNLCFVFKVIDNVFVVSAEIACKRKTPEFVSGFGFDAEEGFNNRFIKLAEADVCVEG